MKGSFPVTVVAIASRGGHQALLSTQSMRTANRFIWNYVYENWHRVGNVKMPLDPDEAIDTYFRHVDDVLSLETHRSTPVIREVA